LFGHGCFLAQSPQRLTEQTNAAFTLAAFANQKKHLLAFSGGDKTVTHKFP